MYSRVSFGGGGGGGAFVSHLGNFVPPLGDFSPSKLKASQYTHAPKMSFDLLLLSLGIF